MFCQVCEKDVPDPTVPHLCAPSSNPDEKREETRLGEIVDVDALLGDVRAVLHQHLHAKLMTRMVANDINEATIRISNEQFRVMVDELARELANSMVLTVFRIPDSLNAFADRLEMVRLDRELWLARTERDGLSRQVTELKALLAQRER